MPENIFNIGIMAQPEYRKRTIAIARGEYTPAEHEPKIWFESLQSMAQVLSNENQKLLKIIIDNQPQSLTELETLSGRSKSNLSRTLKTLEHYGIVETHKHARHLIPTVKATDFRIEFGLGSSEDIGLN